jgi:hypothetical protein
LSWVSFSEIDALSEEEEPGVDEEVDPNDMVIDDGWWRSRESILWLAMDIDQEDDQCQGDGIGRCDRKIGGSDTI